MEARKVLEQSCEELSAFAGERGEEAEKLLQAQPVIDRCNQYSIMAVEAVVEALK